MTSSNPTKKTAGWSLIELISVMLLVAILATYMTGVLRSETDASRMEMTQQRLDAIKSAIIGPDHADTNEGIRANFGFIGDIGRLPTSLGELSSQGTLASWAYSTVYGVGAGWRGPYVSGSDTAAPSTQKDGWGRAFVYSTTLPTPFISSLGADNAAGGASANTDVIVELATSLWRSRLSGNVRDGNTQVASAIVEANFPVAGVLSAVTTTSDANGFYQFNSVPFGVRSLRVISPTASGPRPVVVQRGEFQVPDSALNFRGGAEAVTAQVGTVKNYATGTDILVHLASTYSTPLQLASIKVTWTGGGGYTRLVVNGIAEDFSSVASAATKVVGPTIVIPPKSSDNSLELEFSINMTGRLITVELTWLNRARTDTVTYTP